MADEYVTLDSLQKGGDYVTLADLNAKPVKPMSRLDKLTTGLADPVHGGAQFLTHVLPDSVVDTGNSLNNWLADKTGLFPKLQERNLSSLVTGGPVGVDKLVQDRERAYQEQRKAAGESGLDGWRLTGNIASPANLAMSYAAPARVPMMLKPVVGAATGAASSLLNPVTDGGDYWDAKGTQVGTGAMFGAATPLALGAAARVISPKASTNPQLDLLRKEGVRPTVGQTLGGWANALEEKAQSLPILGDMISYSRNRAQEQFNNAAINRATQAVGQSVKGAGTGAVDDATTKISNAYNAAKAQLGGFTLDQQAAAELQNLRAAAASLPPKEAREFNNVWNTVKSQIGPQGQILPDTFKQIDSHLGGKAANFTGASDGYQQQLGSAVQQMQNIITDNAKRANPQAAAALEAADRAYANLVRVQAASVGAKSKDGVFTPGQLLTAVRQSDQSVRDNATARGKALMQNLATAGQQVLGNKVPDSGTAGRALPWLLSGAAGYANLPATLALLGGGAAAYAPPVQSLLRGAVASRPKGAEELAKQVGKATPVLLPAGAQFGLGLLSQ